MVFNIKFIICFVAFCLFFFSLLLTKSHCEEKMFWVSPDGLEIVVQSESSNETHYFNNDIRWQCYTFKVPGEWHPSSQSISLLEIREKDTEKNVSLGSNDNVKVWSGSSAGIYIYSPRELAGYEGKNPISQAASIAAFGIEKEFGTTLTNNTHESFECSWPKAEKWRAESSILLDGEKTIISEEKIFIDLGEGWVAQISYGKPDNPKYNDDDIRDFIKTFKTTNTPDCYLPFIREKFKPEVGQLATGLMALNNGDYSKSLLNLRPVAEQNYPQAQSPLGWMYEEGLGVTANYKQAVYWYEKAAKQGNPYAQFSLGKCYAFGRGVPENYSNAAKWYLASAEQGHMSAQYNLGLLYYDGIGVKLDRSEALKWFILAGEKGIPQAQFNVGAIYDEGLTVPEDNKEAVKWYLSAAMSGFLPAQERLAYLYAVGEGVDKDYIESFAWYHIATQNDVEVAESRDWVGQQLSFMEKRKAKKRSEELLQSVIQYQ